MGASGPTNGLPQASSSLDRAVPRTVLLECTGAKHRAELVHRSQGLATRHRPSGEGLRAGVLRREDSSGSAKSSVLHRENSTGSVKASVLQKEESSSVKKAPPTLHNGAAASRVTITPPREQEIEATTQNIPAVHSRPQAAEVATTPPKSSPQFRGPPTPHPKPQQGKPMSFLAEMQAAQKRRGLEESPEPAAAQAAPARLQQAAPHPLPAGGGAGSLQEQLRSRLEARKRSVEESEPQVPESLVADIRSSVQVANAKGE